MKTSRKLLVLVCACQLFSSVGIKALADSWIRFTRPSNGQIFYVQPGQSSLAIFWSINFAYEGYDWRTKVKIDNGPWIENVLSAWTDPLGLGGHTFSAELWEMNIIGEYFLTATSSINIQIQQNLPPTITSLSPDHATAGGPSLTLTVTGTNFNTTSVVRWNGSNRTPTTLISSTEVRAPIPASDIATVGTASVTVYNQPPGGGTSNSLTFTINGITVDQQRQNGTRLTGTSVGRWNGSSFDAITITTPPPVINTTVGTREVLRGRQEMVTDPAEKYHVWRRNTADELDTVQNHRGFTITPIDNTLVSRFHPTDPTITIKTDLLDAPGTTGGNIQFRDPWYIDSVDASHGNNLMNRGMQNAVYRNRPSPFNPDYETEPTPGEHPYRGVFLNQGSDWQPPYYSVGAPSVNTIGGYTAYFLNWEGDPNFVTYQNASAQQTGVVFRQSGATAAAKYKAHLASSIPTATFSNSQRKYTADVGTLETKVALCYTSAGEIWLTESNTLGSGFVFPSVVAAGRSEHARRDQIPRTGKDFT